MLKITSPVLRFGLMTAVVALLPLTEVGAQLAPIALQRTCTAGSQAIIVAGQGGSDTAQFPRAVSCPSDCPGAVVFGTSSTLVGQFLAWEYQWTQIGKSAPSQLGLQVASDVQIEGTSPGVSGWSAPGQDEPSLKLGLNDWDSRWLRSSNISSSGPATFTYYTKTNMLARPEGAASRSGTTTSTCKLAGAGTLSGDPNLSQPLSVRSTVFGCDIEWTQSPDGCAITAVVSPGQGPLCDSLVVSQTETDPPTIAATCTAELNQQGSVPCTYKKYNSILRTWTTVTATTVPPCNP